MGNCKYMYCMGCCFAPLLLLVTQQLLSLHAEHKIYKSKKLKTLKRRST
jgi:hypothetical protein